MTGVALFAFAALPYAVLMLVNANIPLGSTPSWRATLLTMDTTWEFWLLMAVGSYGLVPLLEETFYRGYCQVRLQEDLGAPTAILATAALFVFSHGQYLVLDVLNIGTFVTLGFNAIAWGYVFYRTRSLVPTIVAHMLINLPLPGMLPWVILLGMLVVCVLARRTLARFVSEFAALMRGVSPAWPVALVTLCCGLFAVGFTVFGDLVVLLGLACFLAALALDWLDRRRRRAIGGAP
jgi:membrane protease YdiL (CAAX protease family)